MSRGKKIDENLFIYYLFDSKRNRHTTAPLSTSPPQKPPQPMIPPGQFIKSIRQG